MECCRRDVRHGSTDRLGSHSHIVSATVPTRVGAHRRILQMRTEWRVQNRLLYFSSVLALFALYASAPLSGAMAEERTAFRVCADPNYLPYSNRSGEGFENRLAQLLADDLGLPVEYTWFPQRMGFIRNTLRAKDAGGYAYKCDVVMGLPKGYELAITTEPYYRSTYALVYVKGRDLDDIRSAQDLIDIAPERKQKLRLGMASRNPGNAWLQKHGMLDRIVRAYPSQSGDPNIRPGELEQKDLLDGRIDATIAWGPIAGYFAKTTEDVEIEVIPLGSEPGVHLDYAISAGVRFGDKEWRDELNGLLERNTEQIQTLLEEYNIPLVEEGG